MAEGLKNARPTFFRMMRAIPKNQLQRNVFMSVDDIVVASRRKAMQLDDLAETFTNMHSTVEAKPREMCLWRAKGKCPGLPSTCERNQS
jgi:hypothetical protein